ncbi:VOC family protein [Pseudoxanthomonas mexicana]|uniref:bleomycin resistance protein n=1 Tax=Pseudoxanthomonas mexicana TaxID=128785 RepID=UPI0028AB44B9|nr:VOC family protein [Pseudoxanthomonas mexicana]
MPQIIPMQPVRHLPRAIAFYEKLGFTLEDRRDDWGWARLRWGDCQVMLDQSINANPDAPRGAVLYLYPDDVSVFHAQVRANGLDVPKLETTFYGMREFRIDDPDGNRLWIGQVEAA